LIRGVATVGHTIGSISSRSAAEICGSTERWARAGLLPAIIPALLANIALHSAPASKKTLFEISFINTKISHRLFVIVVTHFATAGARSRQAGARFRWLALQKQTFDLNEGKEHAGEF
jgi:hypothetical protein